MVKTRIGILGYGNLGRGVELACRQNDDLELVALFTRRDPASVHPLADSVTVYAADDLAAHADDVDVLVLCGGSANDLPEQTPACRTCPQQENNKKGYYKFFNKSHYAAP